jgi:hypothetical protein
MFGEKIFNFSEPISRKTVRIVILVSFLAYQGMRLLWKQELIPPLLFFLVSTLLGIINWYLIFRSDIKKRAKISLLVFLAFALVFEISHVIYLM